MKKKERELLLRLDYEIDLEEMTAEQCKQWLEWMFYYRRTWEILENIDSEVRKTLKHQIREREEDKSSYYEVCEKRRKAVETRRNKEKEKWIQENTNVYKCIQSNTNDTNSNSKCNSNINIKENIIKEKKSSVSSSKLSIPTSSDLVQAYELDTDLHGLFNQRWYTDEWAIEEWINYKQSWTKMTNWKKVSPYTSVRSCLTQLRKYAKVVSPDRLRPDIWPRFRLAVDKAIMKRDGIYWNDTYEKEYLDSKDLKQVEQDFTI